MGNGDGPKLDFKLMVTVSANLRLQQRRRSDHSLDWNGEYWPANLQPATAYMEHHYVTPHVHTGVQSWASDRKRSQELCMNAEHECLSSIVYTMSRNLES